jgi:hypothetical protein
METIRRNGRPAVGFGLAAADPTDLFAYRRLWEPFIRAHLNLWRKLNDNMEGSAGAQQCPPGIFPADQIANLSTVLKAHCAALDITRMRIDPVDANGISAQWNLWSNRSSAEILAAADVMLKQQQDVVARVAGQYKDQLLAIGKQLDIPIELPPVPSISSQQSVIAQLEGAYTTVKGVLQIAGYGTGTGLMWASNQSKAVAEGITDTVKGAAAAAQSTWTWIGLGAIVVLAGAGLIVYYVPKAPKKEAAA